jgi:predicted NUDIX family NTP pyrophosphohydrolase
VEEDEDLLATAIREFREETGFIVDGDFIPLKPVVQPSGKVVHAWALQRNVDAGAIQSNLFSMEWPPRSGKMRQFPEIDRAAWFPIDVAHKQIFKGQAALLRQLVEKIEESPEKS